MDHRLTEHLFTLAPRDERLSVRVPFSLGASDGYGGRLTSLAPEVAGSPSWAATLLPARRQAGGLVATLRSVDAGRNLLDVHQPAGNSDAPAVAFEVSAAGEWKPFYVEISDASGAFGGGRCSFEGAGPYVAWVPAGLCRTRVYRLRVEFSRVLTTGARPDSTLRMASVPVGAVAIPLPRQAGTVVATPGTGAVDVYGRLDTPRKEWRFRAFSRRMGTGSVVSDTLPLSGNPQDFSFELPIGTKSFDLVIEGFRSRFVEWTVQPRWPP